MIVLSFANGSGPGATCIANEPDLVVDDVSDVVVDDVSDFVVDVSDFVVDVSDFVVDVSGFVVVDVSDVVVVVDVSGFIVDEPDVLSLSISLFDLSSSVVDLSVVLVSRANEEEVIVSGVSATGSDVESDKVVAAETVDARPAATSKTMLSFIVQMWSKTPKN